ncbi:hypothetical protein L7F22_036901 [Adiantum nelumboides]|nr:hypothetical protein [Adiantum nelumboides]
MAQRKKESRRTTHKRKKSTFVTLCISRDRAITKRRHGSRRGANSKRQRRSEGCGLGCGRLEARRWRADDCARYIEAEPLEPRGHFSAGDNQHRHHWTRRPRQVDRRQAISGVQTVRFKNELVRNITIKLGYANAKIYRCENDSCPRPQAYRSYPSNKEDNPPCEVPGCEGRMKLLRHVSFVDCPGHDILMATMLNGAAVMDAALLLIAGNEPCPQPQTSEHLAAVEIMKLKHIIILQNKVDLIREAAAEEHYNSIVKFVKGTVADGAPIVPVSAQLKYNIDAVNEYIVKKCRCRFATSRARHG